MDSVQDGSGVFESSIWLEILKGGGDNGILRASFAASGRASANPTGVEQPRVDFVVLHLLCQHLGVSHWVQSQEGLGKAG